MHSFVLFLLKMAKFPLILKNFPKMLKTTEFRCLVGADQTEFSPTKTLQKRPEMSETTKSGHTDELLTFDSFCTTTE